MLDFSCLSSLLCHFSTSCKEIPVEASATSTTWILILSGGVARADFPLLLLLLLPLLLLPSLLLPSIGKRRSLRPPPPPPLTSPSGLSNPPPLSLRASPPRRRVGHPPSLFLLLLGSPDASFFLFLQLCTAFFPRPAKPTSFPPCSLLTGCTTTAMHRNQIHLPEDLSRKERGWVGGGGGLDFFFYIAESAVVAQTFGDAHFATSPLLGGKQNRLHVVGTCYMLLTTFLLKSAKERKKLSSPKVSGKRKSLFRPSFLSPNSHPDCRCFALPNQRQSLYIARRIKKNHCFRAQLT